MEVRIEIGKCRNFKMEKKKMEPNKMKQKRRKYLYAAAALGMTFL